MLIKGKGPAPQPAGFLSYKSDIIAKGWLYAFEAVAAIALVTEASKLTLGKDLPVYTSHNAAGLLSSTESQGLSDN